MRVRDFRFSAAAAALALLALAGCSTPQPPAEAPQPAAPAAPTYPPSIQPDAIVGSWGYGSFHRPEDLVRTEAAARAECSDLVVINRGPNGGLMMYLADDPQLHELQVKGSPDGKNYIGPPGQPGGMEDREIVSFDGRTMVLKWMDPEVAGRYGIGVYVRCAPHPTSRPARRPPPQPLTR
jgi:hypothetical protein